MSVVVPRRDHDGVVAVVRAMAIHNGRLDEEFVVDDFYWVPVRTLRNNNYKLQGFAFLSIQLAGNLHKLKEGRKCVYLTKHSTHFIYGYLASYIW